MVLMLRRLTQLFFVVVLLVSFLETGFAHSDVLTQSHSSTQDHVQCILPEEEPSANDEHCPFEAIHHCCHVNVVLKLAVFKLVAFSSDPQVFWDFDQLAKPCPFLDGPFQPPRI